MIIVNLTTTSERLHLCRIAITSLLLQSLQAHRINLWVSNNPYLRDNGIDIDSANDLLNSLPDTLRHIVKIRWTSNIGPYRKLIPILREANDDDIIITADDDIFYGQNWLYKLLKNYDSENTSSTAIAARVRYQKRNIFDNKTSYVNWQIIKDEKTISEDYIVTFGGGCVLSKTMFMEDQIYDDSFLSLAPTADDLWYSKLLEINNISISIIPSALEELSFIIHNDGLNNSNFAPKKELLGKLKGRTWDQAIGYLGFSVCGNDLAYQAINTYFQSKIKN